MRMRKTSRQTVRLMGSTAMLVVFGVARGWCADISAASDPLMDLFIKKGYVTREEAEKVKAEADFNRTNSQAYPPSALSKWKISNGIQSVELFGDIRLRYESRKAEDPKGGSIDLNRLRYALRVGLRGDAFDDFYYGFRLETSGNPRSSWVTMGTASPTSSSSPYYQGPFGKSTAGIDVGQIYLGWRPENWAEVTFGKMPNPFYTTPMVWNPSLNPEGAAEHFKYTVGEADFFANFAQFLYQDTNPNRASKGYFNFLTVNSSDLPFLLAWQGGVNYHLSKEISFKVAPALYNYLQFGSHSPATSYSPDFSGTYVGQGQPQGQNAAAYYNLLAPGESGGYDGFAANQTGINDLMVLDIPFELNVKLEKVDVRLFGDYAQNLEGGDRARAAYNVANSTYFSTAGAGGYPLFHIATPQIHDDVAYQIGLAVGSPGSLGLVNGTTAKKHSWELRTYWQHIEQYSLDPNLLDTDFFEGVENLQGFYFAAAYGITDNFIGTIRYGNASRINNKLGTGGSGQDIPQMNPINNFSVFQVDLTFRF